MINYLRLFLMLSLYYVNLNPIYGQKLEKPINLMETKFEIRRVSLRIINQKTISPSYYRIIVDIPENVKINFNKLSKNTIIQLLNDPVTDWTANLLLYERYKKDAIRFLSVIQSRDDWLKFKDDDIEYWKRHIK